MSTHYQELSNNANELGNGQLMTLKIRDWYINSYRK